MQYHTKEKTLQRKSSNRPLQLFFALPQAMRFLLVGGVNTGISYLMFLGFLWFLGQQYYQYCLAWSWALCSVISFSMQKIFVFQTRGHWVREYSRCVLTWLLAYGINVFILELFVTGLGIHPAWAQLFSLILTTALTYILFKKFAFQKETSHD